MRYVVDGAGHFGTTFAFAMIIAFSSSALLIFLYLWMKGRLDMDEGPKYEMMTEEEQSHGRE